MSDTTQQAGGADRDYDYEVVIAGASFAGLAVAAQLQGRRVLLLDRKPIGTGQTSACGTLVRTLQELGLSQAILQVHDRLVVHAADRDFVFPVPEPFCTFDYEHLCHLLRRRTDAEFVLSPALGLAEGGVQTAVGVARGAILVDASGWRAVLGRQLQPDLVDHSQLNFGIETTIVQEDDGLHFWFDPQRLLPMGIGWAFPSGGLNRVGVGSYCGESRLGSVLDRFVTGLGGERNGTHGGHFPHRLRPPVLGELFLVGDAAGQCLPMTGEGIRPALVLGTHLGLTLGRVLDGAITLDEGQRAYRRLVMHHSLAFTLLDLTQRVLPRLPTPLVQLVLAGIRQPPVLERLLDLYLGAFRLAGTVSERTGASPAPLPSGRLRRAGSPEGRRAHREGPA